MDEKDPLLRLATKGLPSSCCRDRLILVEQYGDLHTIHKMVFVLENSLDFVRDFMQVIHLKLKSFLNLYIVVFLFLSFNRKRFNSFV